MEEFVYAPKCLCLSEDKETIIVDKDENYSDISTVYYHCPICGIDEWIVDFFTHKILYEYGT